MCLISTNIYYEYHAHAGMVSPLGEYYDINLPNIPIVLDDVRCKGDETSLLDCNHDKLTYHTCVHYEDIVLECTGTV